MSGHGHVTPNADGSVASCGGSAICRECAIELAAKHLTPQQAATATRYEIRTAAGELCHGGTDEQRARALYPKFAAHQDVALLRVEVLRASPAYARERDRHAATPGGATAAG